MITHLGTVVGPEIGEVLEHGAETGEPPAVPGWEIHSAEEGFTFGREPDVEGPATVAGQRLHERHVDVIDVGAFLPVHLDGDKMLIELGGDGFVRKGLFGHDVAPVAGAVADGEEDGFVLGLGLGEGLFAPRIPVHGIVGVLTQVRGFFVDQPIRIGRDQTHGQSRE